MVLNLTTAESIQVMIAYHSLLEHYEEQWALTPNEDHNQEREWYNETLSKIAHQVSDAIHEDTALKEYLSHQQDSSEHGVDVYDAIKYERTK